MAQIADGVGLLVVVFSTLRVNDLNLYSSALGVVPFIGWVAIIASVIGSMIGLVTEWGVPTINSLLAASLTYWLLKLLLRRSTSLQTA